MSDIDNKKKDMSEHRSAASMALSINDYLSAYQNFTLAGDDAKDLSSMELRKKVSDEYLSLSEECYSQAKHYLALLNLSPDEEAKIRPRRKVRGLQDFIGIDAARKYIMDNIVPLWKNHELYKRNKNGIFLYGPEGVGKTVFVQSIIHELNATGYFFEPFKNFSIYDFPNIKEHMKDIFKMAEEKDNVVFYFEKSLAFFPERYSKESDYTAKMFMKFVKKEIKRARKLKLNILFIAGTSVPDKINPKLFSKGLFDDFIRIHHMAKATRLEMIKDRMKDARVENDTVYEKMVEVTHHLITKDLSRLCRQAKKMAALYTPKGETPFVSNEIIDKVIKDFVKSDVDIEFDKTVDGFEKSLPAGTDIVHGL